MIKKMNASVQALNFCKIHENHFDCLGCIECGRPIPDPACPQCITDEFISWMDNYGKLKNKKKMIKEISKFIGTHKDLMGHSETCIECGKENAFICPYCFTTYLWGILKKNRPDKKLLEEFLVLFNFDHGHKGYWKEGERLGIL
jgi:hypothetical protein